MTRVNVGIDPRELPDNLLFTEYREITRIPNALKSGRAKLNQPIPEKFCLGTGHVVFFYDKLEYLYRRYLFIQYQLRLRKVDITDTVKAFSGTPKRCWGDYSPTDEDREVILKRFKEKGHVLLQVRNRDVSL